MPYVKMRWKLFAILAMLAVPVSASQGAPLQQNDREIDGLKGPVKIVNEEMTPVDAESGKLVDERIPVVEATYDADGNLTDRKSNETDFVDHVTPVRIDANTWLMRSNMGDHTRRRSFDWAGKLIEQTTFNGKDTSSPLLSKARYKYDSNGRVAEIESIRDNGNMDTVTVIKRGADGHTSQQEYRDSANKPPYASTYYDNYKVDAHGNWIERTGYEFDPSNGKPVRTLQGIYFRTITYYDTKHPTAKNSSTAVFAHEIDQRTTRHAGYAISQCKRKRVEEIFGWLKTVGGLRKTRHRGVDRVGWMFTFALAAYNLVRMRNLATA